MTASRNRVLFRPVIPLALVTGLLGVGLIGTAGCTKSTAAPATGNVAAAPAFPKEPAPTPAEGAQPPLAANPEQVGADLIADELALRDPATGEPALTAAARRQQRAYRAIGRNDQWDSIIRPMIPAELADVYARNVDARHQLNALAEVRDTLPAWRIIPPAPAEELLGFYREAEAATGVGWNYLAAINFVETRFGSIAGTSTAGAQGPMQFMPPTWAAYSQGGEVTNPRDAIMAAGRYLAANGFAASPDRAIFAYNHANTYVRAVQDYAGLMANDPAAFPGYYRWEVYYYTTAGDVLLPIGYSTESRIPVGEYLASHPQ
ncbi:MAG: transglycosylase SLT domain-containing protein [Mycobacterium sp.]|nr:transglycosylase SLT domain-containing protein [Mycobacterium sp.]